MARYLSNRLAAAIPTLLIISIISFGVLHLLPGDSATAILGQDASPEQVQLLRQRLGLNRPLHVQYFSWLGSVLSGDLGTSLRDNRSVSGVIVHRLPVSIQLGIYSLVISILLGVPLGILAATRRNSIWDWLGTTLSLTTISLPVFVIGLGLVYLFALALRMLPAGGYVPMTTSLPEHFRLMLLPAVAHAGATVALIMRMTRSSMLEVIQLDYMRTATAKGLHRLSVLYRHGLPNALLPVVTVAGLQAGYLLGSAVITETVFSIPGMGRLLIDSLVARDYPIVQACLLVFACIFVLLNLIADLLYSVIDPRVRYS